MTDDQTPQPIDPDLPCIFDDGTLWEDGQLLEWCGRHQGWECSRRAKAASAAEH